MASMLSDSAQELLCPVCQDIFRDPVLLPCGHSFCNGCVAQWWATKRARQCPLCKRESSKKQTPRNLVLKSLCETFLLEVHSGHVCQLHTERFKLYCEDHQAPVCVVCGYSREHKDHRLTPVAEAAAVRRNDLCASLGLLQEKVKHFHEVKANYERTVEFITYQTQDTEVKIREEFKGLREFLQTEEQLRIAALKDEEAHKRSIMNERIASLTRGIHRLESTIQSIKEAVSHNDVSLLLTVSTRSKEAQQPLPDNPQEVTGSLIDVAKYLGNLRFSVWCKMKEMVSYSPVIMNPNTAHQDLHFESSLTTVRCGLNQSLPTNPERMEHHHCVLGFNGYNSGSHSWDVEVGDNQVWAVGVIAIDAGSIGDLMSRLWMVRFCKGKFTAFSPSCPASVLPHKYKPQKVRVKLNLTRPQLSIVDLDADTAIHTFTCIPVDTLFPYFNTWNSVPLKILPRQISVTL